MSFAGGVPCGRELRVLRNRLRRPRRLLLVLRHRLLGDAVERLAGRAVEHVEPPRLRRLRDALLAAGVEQHDGARRVEVPDVVVHLLEVPLQLAGLHVERDDRRGVEVLAGPLATEPVGSRVAGREVEEPEIRIDGGRLPDRRAAAEIHLRFPSASCCRRARSARASCTSARPASRLPRPSPRGTSACRTPRRRRRCRSCCRRRSAPP